MQRRGILSYVMVGLLSASFLLAQGTAGVLDAEQLKRTVPSSFFFAGQSAPVQMRNSGGFRLTGGKVVLAGLVDTSGYASDIAQKYQGFLITEVKVNIGGSSLGPGAYGFGVSKDGKFSVMDVAATELLSVQGNKEDSLAHPVPLKVAASGDGYRLYLGRVWVGIKAE